MEHFLDILVQYEVEKNVLFFSQFVSDEKSVLETQFNSDNILLFYKFSFIVEFLACIDIFLSYGFVQIPVTKNGLRTVRDDPSL
jgi:hypothetical protein